MNKNKIRRRIFAFIKRAFSRALYVLNLFLFISFCLQLCFCFLYFTKARFTLPEFVNSRIIDKIQSIGIDVKFSKASISIDGIVCLDDISARFISTANEFIKVDKVSVNFLPSELLMGNINLKSIKIQNARLVPTYGDIENTPLIDSLYVNIRKKGDWINIDNAQMNLFNIAINLSGFVNKNFKLDNIFEGFFADEKREGDSHSLSIEELVKKYDLIFDKQDEFKKYTNIFTDPMVDIYLELYSGYENSAKLTIYSSQAIVDLDGEDAVIKDLQLGIFYENIARKDYISASLDAKHFQRKNFPSFNDFKASSSISISKDLISLQKIDIAVKQIVYDGSKIGNVWFKKEHLDETNWRKDWQIYATLDTYRFAGDVSFADDDKIIFNFDGCFDPNIILDRHELADIETLKDFEFYHGIDLKGFLEFNPVSKYLDVQMSINTNDCVAVGIHAENISGNIKFSSEDNILSATDVVVSTKEGWGVIGAYHQNIEDKTYTILAKGQLRPMALSSFMPAWWDNIMGSFDFQGDRNFPTVDASVVGTWGDPDFIWCFVSAKGSNLSYSGADFKDFSLNALVTPKQITIYDVFVKNEDRMAHGTIGWFYKNGITTFENQRLFFESSLNSIELEALGGKDAKSVLDIVQFKNPPRITINGLLYNHRNNPENKKDIFNIEAFSSGDTLVDRFTLKNVSFEAKSDTVNTNIDNLNFQFASGSVKGQLDLVLTKDDVYFDTALKADDMNQLEFIDFLESLGSSKDKDKEGSFSLKGAENGLVDLNISLKGNLNDIQKSVGFGNASVKNDKLMDLHLFGLISRALNSLNLPFGAFKLNYGESNFVIRDEYVKFQDLLLTGDLMHIDGSLIYHYMQDNLDGRLLIDPLEGWSTPIISDVAKILTSITSAVEVKLSKSISAPDISVSVKPLNLIRSDENIIKNIRDSKKIKISE